MADAPDYIDSRLVDLSMIDLVAIDTLDSESLAESMDFALRRLRSPTELLETRTGPGTMPILPAMGAMLCAT